MDTPDSIEAGIFSIGELSKCSGVNAETIRYYERIKMLPAPPRTAAGRRVYSAAHLRALAFIRRSRELQFPLDAIRELLRLGAPGSATCREVQNIAVIHLEDIRSKINTLARLESLLAQAIERCSAAMPCPVLEILDGRPIAGKGKKKSGSDILGNCTRSGIIKYCKNAPSFQPMLWQHLGEHRNQR
jgi:MerR family mercuric resistance operon transcriptional regulator